MVNEVLCKALCHNLCVLIMSQCELGIEPVFWPEEAKRENPDVVVHYYKVRLFVRTDDGRNISVSSE